MNVARASEKLEDLQRMDLAAEWALRLREEPLQEEDISAWLNWCETDPRNLHEFDRAQKLLILTRALSPAEINPQPAASRASSGSPRARTLWRVASAVGFACVAAVAVLGAWWMWRAAGPHGARVGSSPPELVHTTVLPDGSRMELAAKTVVSVDYTAQQRAIELQGGEAYFTVEPNRKRPFVVAVGPVRVRAVGTAFNVRRAGERVVVTVTQGSVDVYQPSHSSAVPVSNMQLAAGGQLAWGRDSNSTVVAVVEPAAALAWREGRLEYSGEPLEAVIADINRYSSRPVLIVADSVKTLRFTGTVLTASTDEWLHALPGSLPVQLREQGNAVLIDAVSARVAH